MEKVMLVSEYRAKGLRFEDCLDITGITRSQFYHKPNGNKPGKPPTKETKWNNPNTNQVEKVVNARVVEEICQIKGDTDQPDYYKLICVALCLKGYFINHKKVYRLMKEHGLLLKKAKSTGKEYVKHRRVIPAKPLEILEMDIKYIWINQSRKYAYVLTILDTFTRCVLCYSVGYSMRTTQVKEAWEFVIATYFQGVIKPDVQLQVEIRNDNGKQFSSDEIREFFKENFMMQVFTHPYTPEENGHVESFHKTLGKAIRDDEFATLGDAEKRLDEFYNTYNNHRTHSATKVPPAKFWVLYDLGKIEVIIIEKERKSKFKLKVALQEVANIPNIKKYENWVIRA